MTIEVKKIALTIGDPAGIGPEIIVGSWNRKEFATSCQRFVVGHPSFLRAAIKSMQSSLNVVEIDSPNSIPEDPEVIGCMRCTELTIDDIHLAKVDPGAGQVAVDALESAIQLALKGDVDAIVTAPLNKLAIHRAGVPFPGHTELLGDRCGSVDVAMMLYLDQNDRVLGKLGLGVVHTTLHESLRSAVDNLNEDRVVSTAMLAGDFVTRLAKSRMLDRHAKVAVAALNPHGGENGLFGDEESRIIEPAVNRIVGKQLNWTCQGPLPCDSLMVRAAAGEFDAIVAMYHDQGHIALKLLGMKHAVNVTLGLPIVRTSVAHGTAFDIAWKGIADGKSLVRAVEVARELCGG